MTRLAFCAAALAASFFTYSAMAQTVSTGAQQSRQSQQTTQVEGGVIKERDPRMQRKVRALDPSWIDPDTGFLKSPERIANPQNERVAVAPWEVDQAKVEDRRFLYEERAVIQDQLTKAFVDTCGGSFRVELDRPSFLASPAARKNVLSYSSDAIQVSMNDLCKDNRTRAAVGELMSFIKVVNDDKMTKPDALGDVYTVTITYAFSSRFPMQAKELTPKLYSALQLMLRQYDQRRTPVRAPVAIPEE